MLDVVRPGQHSPSGKVAGRPPPLSFAPPRDALVNPYPAPNIIDAEHAQPNRIGFG